jgi:uncharacterized ion transporter superfamily protein YfcC
MRNETIQLSEILDEGWKLYFAVVKGFLLVLTLFVSVLTMIVFGVAQRAFYVARRARTFTEQWVPVRPAIFNLVQR